ncbi:protein YrbN [Klebsiella pneumoniae]|nr:protein YrbN [Klebsiella pneumoniae]
MKSLSICPAAFLKCSLAAINFEAHVLHG